MKNVIRRVLVAVAAAAAVVSLGFTPASAAPDWTPYVPDNTAGMKATAPGDTEWIFLLPKIAHPDYYPGAPVRCADIFQNSLNNGAKTILWDCVLSDNQQWAPIDVIGSNPYGTVMLVNKLSGKCLDLEGNSTANGAPIIQWNCHNGWNQQWEIVFETEPDPTQPIPPYQLRNRKTGKCLDVTGAVNANGAALIQWDCKGSDNQKWNMFLI